MTPSKRTNSLILTALAALAIFLRVRLINTTQIWSDQSFTLNTAMRWINGGDFPLASNKASVGFINPPMVEYVYGVAFKVWPDVRSAAYITMLLGVGAIWVTYWATKKQFGQKTAVFTITLFVVNPWLVYYSQLIWNQTLVPFFAAATFCLLWLYVTHENKGWYFVGSCVAASCMTQVHPGSVIQLGAMGIIMLIFWRKLRVAHVLLGGISFFFLYIPYIIYERSVDWIDIKTILALSGEPASVSISSFLVSLDLLQSQGISPTVFKSTHTVDSVLRVLFSLALVFVIGRLFYALVNRKEQVERNTFHKLLPLLIWFAIPILVYLRPSFHLQIYYLLGQIPVHFIIIGFTLTQLSNRFGKVGLSIASVGVLAIMIWQTAFTLGFQNERLDNDKFQVRHARATIEQINTFFDADPTCKLTVITDGHSVEVSDLSLLTSFTDPAKVLITDGDLAVPTPEPCGFYLDTLQDSLASDWVKSNGEAMEESAGLLHGWKFRQVTNFPSIIQPTLPLEDLTFTNGLRLNAIERADIKPNESLSISMDWSLVEQPAEKQMHFGTYLLTENNEVVAQMDGPGFDSIQWRKGDSFKTWFTLPVPDIPAGTYKLAVAIYGWPDLTRENLLNGQNTLFIETVEIQ